MATDSSNHFGNVWNAIDSYFKSSSTVLVRHQLDSYNDFIAHRLNDIITSYNPIDINHAYMPEQEKFQYIMSVELVNPVLAKPMIYEKDGSSTLMTPMDARQRSLSYSAAISVDVNVTVRTWSEENADYITENKQLRNVSLGKLPIMVRSDYCMLKNPQHSYSTGECCWDPGAYFIINGCEKVIIAQDRIAENKTYVFAVNKVSPEV